MAAYLSIAKIPDREEVKAAYILRNCNLRTADELLLANALPDGEFSDWVENNDGFRRFRMPNAVDFPGRWALFQFSPPG